MADEYTIGDLARQDIYPDETLMQPPPEIPASSGEEYAGLGGDPRALATGIKNWWTNQPSWMQKVGDVTARDTAAYQSGGAPAVIGQLADTSAEQDLLGGFGGNTKSVTGKVVPGALAALGDYHPPFYSAVEQAVAGAKQTTAPGQQWRGFLSNQPGVKPEELSTLKLGDLFDQTGAVTKQDLLDHIAANKVQLGEVVKGARDASAAELEKVAQERYGTSMSDPYLTEGQRMAIRDEAMVSGAGNDYSPTKFSQYTLPGGENYREMLLTLPEQKGSGFDPAKVELRRKQQSTTQGSTIVSYDGKNIGTFDDPPQLNMQTGQYAQRPDQYWIDIMRRRYGGDPQMGIKPLDQGVNFRSSHYDEPNILAHVRYNDRVIDGKKTLFVEEVQSDWHQKGKREGYGLQITPEAESLMPEIRKLGISEDPNNISSKMITDAGGDYDLATKWWNLVHDRQVVVSKGPPDAPFKTTWPDLAMKKVIRQAAEGGYDKVAWTPGSVQADRYDLSKHVDGIQVSGRTDAVTGEQSHGALVRMRNGNDLSVGYGKDGIIDNTGASNIDWKGKHLSDVFGKDIAEKMMAGKSVFDADLKIGGEGMKGFYDQILPAAVNKIVKKAGGRVGQGEIQGSGPDLIEEGRGNYRKPRPDETDTYKVHTLDITPQLREMALKKGFPLFTAGGLVAGGAMGDLAKQDEYQ